jgi:hypothetical protein
MLTPVRAHKTARVLRVAFDAPNALDRTKNASAEHAFELQTINADPDLTRRARIHSFRI